MKEIKFRGQRVDNGKWVYGYLAIQKQTYYIILISDKDFITKENASYYADWIEVIPETIGQYTGLKDKEQKEIYDGDIVDITRTCVWEKGIIIYKNGCFFVKAGEILLALYESKINNYTLEVIGNIWDNKDLVEREK